MTDTDNAVATAPRGVGFFGKLIILAMLGFTGFLYLRVIGMVPDPWDGGANRAPAQQVVGTAAAVPVTASPAGTQPKMRPVNTPARPPEQALRPVPEDQLRLIRDVFAPESR